MPSEKLKKTISSSTLEVEESIKIISNRLEERVDFFMANIDSIVRKYRNYHSSVNPPTNVGCINVIPEEPLEDDEDEEEEAAKGTEKETPTPEAAAGGEKTPAADAAAPAKEEASDEADEETVTSTYYVTVTFPDNRRLIKQLQLLRTEAYELATLFDSIYDWITINIPDMNNEDIPGAPVMLAVVEQISSFSETLTSLRNMEQKYYSERAELEKAVLKIPESRMLQMELLTSEEGWWIEAERAWRVLIRVSLLTYTVLARNMTLLKEPEGKSSSAAFYQ